jgi:hypothetical protein
MMDNSLLSVQYVVLMLKMGAVVPMNAGRAQSWGDAAAFCGSELEQKNN